MADNSFPADAVPVGGPPAASAFPTDAAPVEKGKEPWWLKTAEFVAPAALGYGGEALGEAAGALGGPAAPATVPAGAVLGGAAGNLAADELLNQIRREAGYPEEQIDPGKSLATGAAGTVFGRYGLPIIGKGLKAIGRFAGGVPTADVIEQGGQEAVDKAGEVIENEAANIGKTSNIKPVVEQKAASEITGALGGAQPARTAQNAADEALRHVETQDAAIKPTGRIFEKAGKAIGNKLAPYKDLPVDTTALVGLPNSIGDVIKQNAMVVSPKVAHMLEDAGTHGNTAGGVEMGPLLGTLDNINAALKTAKGRGDRYVLSELRDQYLDIVTDAQNLPADVQRELRPLRADYRTLKDRLGDMYKLGDTTNPAQTVAQLAKRDPVAINRVLDEATPEELTRLQEGAVNHVLGESANPKPADIVARFNELKDTHAAGKLLGSGPFSKAETWADMPRLLREANQNIRGPLKGNAIDGWVQAGLNTPEAQDLASQLRQLRQLPEPEQQRILGVKSAMTKGRDLLTAQRPYMLRQIMFGVASGGAIGMFAHHPGYGALFGGILASREAIKGAVHSNPELYLNFLRAAASPTAQGLKRAGYFAGRLASYDLAHYLHERMRENQ